MKRTIKITESQINRIVNKTLNEYYVNMDEATEETIKKTTYTKSDIDQAKQKGVGIDVKDGTVTPTEDGGMVVTSESDYLLDEDIFEEEKDIDTWDDVPMMK